jgi:hypothetical protein
LEPLKWPTHQRFDYLTRTRELTTAEANHFLKSQKEEKSPASFEQREALLFAIRELTGQDLGTTYEDWNKKSFLEGLKNSGPGLQPAVKTLPLENDPNETGLPQETGQPANPMPGSVSAKLARELVQAEKADQGRVLERLRDGKGVVYTEALAAAIPQLDNARKRQVREALAERLTRMRVETLGSYLKDSDAEIRRGAALAVAMKDAKGLVPNLIPLLGDQDELVWRAALLALRELTGQNIGDKQQDWQDWWNRQKK